MAENLDEVMARYLDFIEQLGNPAEDLTPVLIATAADVPHLVDEIRELRARPVNLSGRVGKSVEWDTSDHSDLYDDED